mgnify:CR=1 FL=1
MATRDTKRRAVRPDDPHMAQLKAIESIIPTVDSGLGEDDVGANSTTPADLTTERELKAPTMPQMTSDMAEMMSRMQKQIDQLQGELAQVRTTGVGGEGDEVKETGPGGFPYQYYKRPKTGPMAGWVVYGPGGATPKGQRDAGSYTKYTGSKGFKALTRYGVCPVPRSTSGALVLIPMLERGGAVEFPVAQVVALKWHVSPPIPGLVFPDYEAHKHEVQHFLCEDCDYEMYFVESDREASSACFRHLRNNSRDGRHNMRREEAVMVLKSQGITPVAGRFAAAAAKKEVEGLAREPSE